MCSSDKWMVPTIWKTLPNRFENGKYLLTLRPQIEGYTHLLFSILPTVKVQRFWPQQVGAIFHLFWHLLSKSADLSKQLEDNCEILCSSQKRWTLFEPIHLLILKEISSCPVFSPITTQIISFQPTHCF